MKPRRDYKTVHLGLVLGVATKVAPRFPTVGLSSEKRWAASTTASSRKPSVVKVWRVT